MAARANPGRVARGKRQNRASSANEVRLRGRLAAEPEARELPSGDEVVTLRLIVDRPRTRVRAATVDTIDCTVWAAALRARVTAWQPGDFVEVQGALRRRFWKSPQGSRSRYDVEVIKASRPRGAGSAGDG